MRIFRVSSVTLMSLVLCSAILAQTTTQADQQTIQTLLREVKELKARVAALEAERAQAPEAAQKAESEAAEAQMIRQLGESKDIRDLRGIHWHGFGEFNYKALDQRLPELGTFGFVPGSAGNFYTGDFDLLLTSSITDKTNVLAELVMGEGDAQSFDVDLERVLFNYRYSDNLEASFGRYHTGIGYYNTAFHSGKWLQTTADRPLIMEFANDGGLLPTQAVGVSLTGAVPSGKLGLHYLAEYGSSDTIRPQLNGVTETDENNGNHFNLGFFVRPDNVPGLQVGGSIYHDRISDFARGADVRLGQTIANAYVVYSHRGIEFLNEGFLIRHAYEQSSTVFNMPAFYTQFSKQIQKFRPYFRYQYVNANPASIFSDVQLRHGPSFGARYDMNDFVALKAQLDHTIRKNQPDLNGLQMQLAFSF